MLASSLKSWVASRSEAPWDWPYYGFRESGLAPSRAARGPALCQLHGMLLPMLPLHPTGDVSLGELQAAWSKAIQSLPGISRCGMPEA
eukprot:7507335-Alexandrium_andersonii.AAC.1